MPTEDRTTTSPAQRLATPGETCECGRPALVVYVTERFGEVPFCGIPFVAECQSCGFRHDPSMDCGC